MHIEPDELFGRLSYPIGADFCLDPDDLPPFFRIELRCTIPFGIDVPTVVPPAVRTWMLNGATIYSTEAGRFPMFNESFLMDGLNGVFAPFVVDPPPLDIDSGGASGTITLNLHTFNLSRPLLAPPGVTSQNVNDVVFRQLLGTYRCSVGNVFGTESAETVITECGEFSFA